MNIELNFPPKLRGARSRLYRRRFLQVNTRWKAVAEIYTMHSFAPFANLDFPLKIAENFADWTACCAAGCMDDRGRGAGRIPRRKFASEDP